MWDPRSGLSTCTFYGHRNSCNSIVYTQNGASLASADADGTVKLWDVRMVAEILTINCSKYPANKATFDASGMVSASRIVFKRCMHVAPSALLSMQDCFEEQQVNLWVQLSELSYVGCSWSPCELRGSMQYFK